MRTSSIFFAALLATVAFAVSADPTIHDIGADARVNLPSSMQVSQKLQAKAVAAIQAANSTTQLNALYKDISSESEWLGGANGGRSIFYVFVVDHAARANLAHGYRGWSWAGTVETDNAKYSQWFPTFDANAQGNTQVPSWTNYQWSKQYNEDDVTFDKLSYSQFIKTALGDWVGVGVGFWNNQGRTELPCSAQSSSRCATLNSLAVVGQTAASILKATTNGTSSDADAFAAINAALDDNKRFYPNKTVQYGLPEWDNNAVTPNAFYPFCYDAANTAVVHASSATRGTQVDSTLINALRDASANNGGWTVYEWTDVNTNDDIKKIAYTMTLTTGNGNTYFCGAGFRYDSPRQLVAGAAVNANAAAVDNVAIKVGNTLKILNAAGAAYLLKSGSTWAAQNSAEPCDFANYKFASCQMADAYSYLNFIDQQKDFNTDTYAFVYDYATGNQLVAGKLGTNCEVCTTQLNQFASVAQGSWGQYVWSNNINAAVAPKLSFMVTINHWSFNVNLVVGAGYYDITSNIANPQCDALAGGDCATSNAQLVLGAAAGRLAKSLWSPANRFKTPAEQVAYDVSFDTALGDISYGSQYNNAGFYAFIHEYNGPFYPGATQQITLAHSQVLNEVNVAMAPRQSIYQPLGKACLEEGVQTFTVDLTQDPDLAQGISEGWLAPNKQFYSLGMTVNNHRFCIVSGHGTIAQPTPNVDIIANLVQQNVDLFAYFANLQ